MVKAIREFESHRFRQDELKINYLRDIFIFVPLKIPQKAKAADFGLQPFVFQLGLCEMLSGHTSPLQRLLPLACEAPAEAMRLTADSWRSTFAPYMFQRVYKM